MIGGRAKTNDGRQLLLLGLSEGNLQRLREGKPMHLSHESHVFIPDDWVVLIFSGATEEAMTDELRKAGIDLHGPEGQGKA